MHPFRLRLLLIEKNTETVIDQQIFTGETMIFEPVVCATDFYSINQQGTLQTHPFYA